MSHDNRRSAPAVARCYDAVLRQQEHRARSLDVVKHVFDALNVRTPLNEQQSHQLRLVRPPGGELCEVHVLCQQFGRELFDVVYLCHGHDGKPPQVRVDDQRLGVGVADHADAGRAAVEARQRAFKF